MSIRDIMWEIRLELFGHVCHCERDQDIRREYEMRTEGSRGSGQPKQRWSDTSMLVRSRLKWCKWPISVRYGNVRLNWDSGKILSLDQDMTVKGKQRWKWLSPSTIYYTITSITQWCAESFIFILRATHVILRGKWRASYLLQYVCHGLSRTVTYIKTIAVVTVCQTGSSVAKKGQMKHIYGCLLLGVMRLACLLFDVAGHWELSIHIQTWLGQFLIIFSNLSYKTAFYPVAFLEITLDSL